MGGSKQKNIGGYPQQIKVPKVGESRRQLERGMGKGFPSQPTRGSGKRRDRDPEFRPETPFGVFWRSRNALFCTYISMLWVRQCFISHLGGKAKV